MSHTPNDPTVPDPQSQPETTRPEAAQRETPQPEAPQQGVPAHKVRWGFSRKQILVAGVAALVVLGGGAGVAVAAARGGETGNQVAAAPSSTKSGLDTSAQQSGRVRAKAVPAAVEALKASGFKPVHAGELTVATTGASAPISFHSDDGSTLIGSDVDVAQLVADSLGLKLRVEATSWADWPLGVQSGKYDVVLSNVGVTEDRKDLFDFATYRHGLHSFLVTDESPLKKLEEPADIAGLKIVVGSGTNQEKILQAWNAKNEAAGLKPAELVYYDDAAASLLALRSGRVDAALGPNPAQLYQVKVSPGLRTVGQVNAGWPDNSDVGIVTGKGNGLVKPLSLALGAVQKSGQLTTALTRWGLEGEEVEKVQVNPPGLPRAAK